MNSEKRPHKKLAYQKLKKQAVVLLAATAIIFRTELSSNFSWSILVAYMEEFMSYFLDT